MKIEQLSTAEVRDLLNSQSEFTRNEAYKELLKRRENRERLMTKDYSSRVVLSANKECASIGMVPL